MSKIKVTNFTISLDGFGAGANQSMKVPLGIGGEELHTWMFPTKRFRAMGGKNDGTEGIDNDFVEKARSVFRWQKEEVKMVLPHPYSQKQKYCPHS